MSGGFDATILRFSLQSAPDPFSGPLVLRLFQPTVDPQRAPREGAVQNALAQLGYPAPRVFVAEARIEPLGGPFLIMERMPGRVIGSELEGLSIKGIGIGQTLNILRQLPRIRREVLRLWDEAQTRFTRAGQRFRRSGCERRRPSRKFYFRFRLRAPARLVEQFGLSGLRPAVDWLTANTPRQSTAVICHGDFQSSNVLADNGRLTGVIDWVKATIADPAFDYGAVMAILATVPIRVPAGVHRMLRALMNNLARTHSRQCGTTPEIEAALRYYQVFNCLVQLVTVGKSHAQGNTDTGRIQLPRRRRELGEARTYADRTQPHSSGKLDSCCVARKRSPAHA